jgi:hypothetical protein
MSTSAAETTVAMRRSPARKSRRGTTPMVSFVTSVSPRRTRCATNPVSVLRSSHMVGVTGFRSVRFARWAISRRWAWSGPRRLRDLCDAKRVGKYVGAVDELVDGADEAEISERCCEHARVNKPA